MTSINKISSGNNIHTNSQQTLTSAVPYSSDDKFYINSVKQIEKAKEPMDRAIKRELFFLDLCARFKKFFL